MRVISMLVAALLLLVLVACGGSGDPVTTENVTKFTLSDAEIDAYEASPELTADAFAAFAGQLSSRPLIFAEDTLSAAGKTASVVVGPGGGSGGNGGNGTCGKCKRKCGKCTRKVKSCKCKGGCRTKCGECQSKCNKCSKKSKCDCKGKCQQKCGKCNSNCSKCSGNGNCGCKSKCPPPPCRCKVRCTGMTSTTDSSIEGDCATHCADVTYSVNLTFTDCPHRDDEAAGHEVVFYRNGAEVGRGVTDANGDAEFSEDCVDLGDHKLQARYSCCLVCFDVNIWEDCCEVICTGMNNDTERFFLADCFGDSGSVFLNVQLEFSECPGEPFDKSGHEVVFSMDGVEVGTALTDDDGFATLTVDDVQLGNHHIAAVSDHCATEFTITVHDECAYHACISGKGKLPGKNGDPYMVFQYEGHVQDGNLEMANTMSLADGDINFVNVPIEWLVVLGLEIYFGNDNIMFHTIDNGKAPGVDFCEVWVFDRGYHNSGLLVNGQIRSSWGLKQPPVAIP